jgi:hypothetical protein
LVEIIGVIEENTKECEAWEASKEVRSLATCSSMTLLGVTAILESAHIYLKAGYAFGFTPLSTPISVSVWDPPTKKSELPLKLPMLRILLMLVYTQYLSRIQKLSALYISKKQHKLYIQN